MILNLAVLLAVAAASAQDLSNSSAALSGVQELSGQTVGPLLPSLIKASAGLFQGRKKGDQGMAGAAMLGAMMAAMGLAALAALSGKAIAASMAALMLAAAALMKKHGDGAHSYELITHHGHRSIHNYATDEPEAEEQRLPVSRLY